MVDCLWLTNSFETLIIVQKLREGQSYITKSLGPYMLHKVRKALVQATERPTAAQYIQSIPAETVTR
jgi:hypothetical protein